MAITVIVRSGDGDDHRLTFDGGQRVVMGRGPGNDVRLPDPSVSHRHATIRAQGGDLVVVDEASTNGTFVGSVRIAPRTSRIVRSGEQVRVGRVWIELRIDQGPSTRDLGLATRDLALALVARAMESAGADSTLHLRVVEGPDQGATLKLAEADRTYLVGRGANCDLLLSDQDGSREHLAVVRRADGVFVRDLGAKNGSWMGEARLSAESETCWRPSHMVRMAHNVLSLEEPVSHALQRIESAPDEPMPIEEAVAEHEDPARPAADAQQDSGVIAAPIRMPWKRRRSRWSLVDVGVMVAALGVLALSLAALVWVLRG